jgi:hypothetical protein
MAYFLGTSIDTPLIAFDETDARFNVGEPTPEEMVAQQQQRGKPPTVSIPTRTPSFVSSLSNQTVRFLSTAVSQG